MDSEVAILFARHDSIYKTLPGCDVWDAKRNALNWPGGSPVIAHPPCRAWGQLRYFARPLPGERELAIWAIEQVRKWGGVLEHPAKSQLWPFLNLPAPGKRDIYGGWSLWISQWWFGHRADKPTMIYTVGCEPEHIPPIPFKLGEATHVISSSSRQKTRSGTPRGDKLRGWKPPVTKAEREHTPLRLAEWLVEVARLTSKTITLTGAPGR